MLQWGPGGSLNSQDFSFYFFPQMMEKKVVPFKQVKKEEMKLFWQISSHNIFPNSCFFTSSASKIDEFMDTKKFARC